MLSGGASTSSSLQPQPQQAVIYLYRFQEANTKQEVNLIDLEVHPKQPFLPFQNTLQPNSSNMDVINLKLEDLIGGADEQDFLFQNVQPVTSLSIVTGKTPNVMLEMDVLDYLNRSNEKHYTLMQQVATTRMNCKKLFYQFM